MKLRNPFGFRPGPVSFWTTVVYLAVVIPLIYVHESVPPPPSDRALGRGLNLTEAWLDLQAITRTYHPFNSRQNERVREFLINRSKQILDRNRISYTTEKAGGVIWDDSVSEPPNDDVEPAPVARAPGATIFDDRISNVTWTVDSLLQSTKGGPTTWQGHYFEGNNFYIYIHGKDDPDGSWWSSQTGVTNYRRTGGVLVNCHFDSVSTGYGATDDGVACVSMLQLLSYFTTEGRQPTNGIVLLFNNAEEDGLLGARAFGYSPLLKFCHTFVNLEGAGAGGRAMLFRTTDLQAAQAYSRSPHPFGSVVVADAFERGVIKSGTDFEIFAGAFGQRGMDIAFYTPRSRYHTEDDDARHTSVRSIWHMLSAALASTERLSKTTGTIFDGDRSDGDKHLVQNGKKTEGVWFDWFGSAWTAFPLRGLFAWSLTLLIVTPLVLAVVTYVLVRKDKYYFFANDIKLDSEISDDPVAFGGWRGFLRFPLAFIFAVGLTIASVLLVAKFNPLIIYSSGYAVWAMTVSLFYFSFWLIMRGANFARPSALHRGFAIMWLFILSWALQLISAIAEDRMHIGALYFAAFFHTAVFVSLFISLLEQFGLPGKHEFARQFHDALQEPAHVTSPDTTVTGGEEEQDGQGHDDGHEADTATETTPLRVGEQSYGTRDHTTFASTYRRSVLSDNTTATTLLSYPPYEHEQAWSGRLPTWTWIIQFLFLAPVHIILVGNLGLVQTSALAMTSVDGSSLLAPIMGVGVMTIVLLAPLTPFMHRITHHVPLFLLLVFVGTFIYNLAAFPFSINNRYKFFFQEIVDANEGTDIVTIAGLEDFVRPVIASLPSAAGQHISCGASSTRRSLVSCQYDASSLPAHLANGTDPADLITVKTSKSSDGKTARLQIDALDTKMCILDISQLVFGFSVEGGGPPDRRFGSIPREGLQSIILWRREWEGPWNVTLQLTDEGRLLDDEQQPDTDKPENERQELGDGELKVQTSGLTVTVKCAYSDANDEKTIPTIRELNQYMPKWAVLSKASAGLVEVRKTYPVA